MYCSCAHEDLKLKLRCIEIEICQAGEAKRGAAEKRTTSACLNCLAISAHTISVRSSPCQMRWSGSKFGFENWRFGGTIAPGSMQAGGVAGVSIWVGWLRWRVAFVPPIPPVGWSIDSRGSSSSFLFLQPASSPHAPSLLAPLHSSTSSAAQLEPDLPLADDDAPPLGESSSVPHFLCSSLRPTASSCQADDFHRTAGCAAHGTATKRPQHQTGYRCE